MRLWTSILRFFLLNAVILSHWKYLRLDIERNTGIFKLASMYLPSEEKVRGARDSIQTALQDLHQSTCLSVVFDEF